MAHKLIGYFTSKEEIIDKRIFGQVDETTLWGSATYKIGDGNNATKFAFIATAWSGSGSTREYAVQLWCNTTSTSNASNYIQYYRIYEGSITELTRETIGFSQANSHGYRQATMGIPMIGTILLDSNNLPILRDDNNVVNVYDGDAPSGLEDPAFLAFVDAVFDHPAIPPKGQGTVTLDIPANGANLTFTSDLLGVSVTKMISKDAVVDMEDE